jgi:hypothetical protein
MAGALVAVGSLCPIHSWVDNLLWDFSLTWSETWLEIWGNLSSEPSTYFHPKNWIIANWRKVVVLEAKCVIQETKKWPGLVNSFLNIFKSLLANPRNQYILEILDHTSDLIYKFTNPSVRPWVIGRSGCFFYGRTGPAYNWPPASIFYGRTGPDGRTDFYCRTGPDGRTDGQISMAELARTDGRTDGRNFYLFSFFANFISTNKIFLRMIQYFPSQNFALCPSVRNFYLFN